jgi:hypothetical protein
MMLRDATGFRCRASVEGASEQLPCVRDSKVFRADMHGLTVHWAPGVPSRFEFEQELACHECRRIRFLTTDDRVPVLHDRMPPVAEAPRLRLFVNGELRADDEIRGMQFRSYDVVSEPERRVRIRFEMERGAGISEGALSVLHLDVD